MEDKWPDDRWGVFQPQRTDDLRQGVEPWIGRTIRWTYSGVVDFGGPYEGQRQWAPTGERPLLPAAWVPECDIDFSA